MFNEPNPLCDRIHIEQLEIFAHIGVPDKERPAPQRLAVSISFWPYHEQPYAGSVYRSADVALSSAGI
jgi:Dihydroneopterin aldolase